MEDLIQGCTGLFIRIMLIMGIGALATIMLISIIGMAAMIYEMYNKLTRLRERSKYQTFAYVTFTDSETALEPYIFEVIEKSREKADKIASQKVQSLVEQNKIKKYYLAERGEIVVHRRRKLGKMLEALNSQHYKLYVRESSAH